MLLLLLLGIRESFPLVHEAGRFHKAIPTAVEQMLLLLLAVVAGVLLLLHLQLLLLLTNAVRQVARAKWWTLRAAVLRRQAMVQPVVFTATLCRTSMQHRFVLQKIHQLTVRQIRQLIPHSLHDELLATAQATTASRRLQIRRGTRPAGRIVQHAYRTVLADPIGHLFRVDPQRQFGGQHFSQRSRRQSDGHAGLLDDRIHFTVDPDASETRALGRHVRIPMAAEAQHEQRLQGSLEVLQLVLGQNGFRLLDAQQVHKKIGRRMDFESHDEDDEEVVVVVGGGADGGGMVRLDLMICLVIGNDDREIGVERKITVSVQNTQLAWWNTL